MPIPISYMGTKRQLAPIVDQLVMKSKPGPLLDAFSGMCAISSFVGTKRQEWTNDLQMFSHAVARCHFCADSGPLDRTTLFALASSKISDRVNALSRDFHEEINAELSALRHHDLVKLTSLALSFQDEQGRVQVECGYDNQTLLTRLFSGSYFGLQQTIELDAIRCTISDLENNGVIDIDQANWAILALAVASNQCATVTGHFAQPLTPKERNIARFCSQRLKSIKGHWLAAIEGMTPIGTSVWRQKNEASCGDATTIVRRIARRNSNRPAVIYADPPYTTDQYSRYYHYYETLLLYDNVEARGKGRYRDDRAVSDFSLAQRVETAMREFVSASHACGADLILSYPTNGVLKNSRDVLPKILQASYGTKAEVVEIDHMHSTMGGSKGSGKKPVVEVIYRIAA